MNFSSCLYLILILALVIGRCSKAEWTPSASEFPFTLMQMPFSYDSLVPYISSSIVSAHHDYHHQAYVNKLNAYVSSTSSLQHKTLVQLIEASENDVVLQKFAGGHFNHNMYWWETIAPACADERPKGKLLKNIEENFGNFENFQQEFEKTSNSLFGSGWVWLCDDFHGKLVIKTTENQVNPAMHKICNPILGNDLWEHAYYLQYMYKKEEYIHNFWNIIDWVQVEFFYENYVTLGKVIPF